MSQYLHGKQSQGQALSSFLCMHLQLIFNYTLSLFEVKHLPPLHACTKRARSRTINGERKKETHVKGLGTRWDHVLHQSKMWWTFCKFWFCWSLKSIWNDNNQVPQDCKSCHAIHFTLSMGLLVKTSGACFMVISKWFLCKALVTKKGLLRLAFCRQNDTQHTMTLQLFHEWNDQSFYGDKAHFSPHHAHDLCKKGMLFTFHLDICKTKWSITTIWTLQHHRRLNHHKGMRSLNWNLLQ